MLDGSYRPGNDNVPIRFFGTSSKIYLNLFFSPELRSVSKIQEFNISCLNS